MKISIIVPAYNEEKRIGKTLKAYTEFFDNVSKKERFRYEILVVINNTRDRTEDVVRNFQKKNPHVRFLNLKHRGKGLAITEGFKDALKLDANLLGFVDADMATPPESFYDLVTSIKGYDGAIANRYDAKSKIHPAFTARRAIIAVGFNIFVRGLFFLNYRDTQCGAKIFTRHAIEKIIPHLTIAQWAYDIDLLYLAKREGFRIYSCPTVWYDVEGSKIDLIGTSANMFFAVGQLRILHSPFVRLLLPLKRVIGMLYHYLLARKTHAS